jgi:predicted Zn-dependent peptidase
VLFSRTVLPGGIRVVTERMPEVRSVTIGFWIGVGSRDESEDVQGSSHFLEHTIFKGTKTRGTREIAESFDAVGGEANAFSAKEYTCFYGRIIDKDLPMASDILIDLLRNASLNPNEVESERKVILEEIAMRDDTPDDLVHELFIETLFGDHPLAREVMGTNESVASITPDTLRSFYETHYAPANIVVAAAGNVDHDELVARVEPSFPEDHRKATHREQLLPSPPTQKIRVQTRDTEQAHI